MARLSRSRTAAATIRTPTPQVTEPSGDGAAGSTQQNTSQDVDMDNEQVDVQDEDDQGTPAIESDAGSPPSTPAYGRGGPRRRRGGRSARGSSKRRETRSLDDRENGSDAGTPRKRGGWRGRGFGGGRWAKAKGGPSHVTQVPVDKEGNMANVKDDEVELPEDPEGEMKVTKNGELLGNREYRVRTFKIEGKGARLYMLSTEPARCIGFRDSYLFFQKHKQLYKIIIAEEAKKDLIDRGLIPHSYKGRAIGVVTARSVFREFGAKIVVGGKKVIDDYQVAEARARGDIEGEYAVPEDEVPGGAESYDRNRYVAWHGASSVYHTGAPSVPMANGKPTESKKRKVQVTGANWMAEHSREASRFNSAIAAQRRQNLKGVYDVHTNFMQYPRIMQPTHARWEHVQLLPPDSHPLQNGFKKSDDLMNGGTLPLNRHPQLEGTIFPEVLPMYTYKFLVSDTYYEMPTTSTLGYPGPDEALLDIGPPGLSQVADDVIAELPTSCRQAFFKARAEEHGWKRKWSAEIDSYAKSKLRITYNV
ncbi:MAG: hypothetical protein Q9217_005006 [Psora testacea]